MEWQNQEQQVQDASTKRALCEDVRMQRGGFGGGRRD